MRVIDSKPSKVIVGVIRIHFEFRRGSEGVRNHGGFDGIEQVEVIVVDDSLSNNGSALSEVSR